MKNIKLRIVYLILCSALLLFALFMLAVNLTIPAHFVREAKKALISEAEYQNRTIPYTDDEFFFDDEEVIQSYQFIRDQIILTNYGIYEVDVQGLSGKKVEVKFFPKDTIKTISFETAGTLDFDVDIKIGVTNNTVVNVDGAAYSEPLSFKVPSDQAEEAKEIVRLVKEHYLF